MGGDGGGSNEDARHWDVDARVTALERYNPGASRETFAEYGRLQLIALLRRGLTPGSHVIDVGCGGLRAGYWLMHFLDRGRYHGIEPLRERVDVARAELLEPGLEEQKAPTFDYNLDFDLSVFGVAPRFVLARSVLSHAAKPQIQALLDSFAAVATSDGLLLASYLPADVPANGQGSRGLLARLESLRRRGPNPDHKRRRKRRPDYQGMGWAGRSPLATDQSQRVIAHRFDWIADQCATRDLRVRESNEDNFGDQIWLEVRRR
jgi:SAM-dependent methyltransferase